MFYGDVNRPYTPLRALNTSGSINPKSFLYEIPLECRGDGTDTLLARYKRPANGVYSRTLGQWTYVLGGYSTDSATLSQHYIYAGTESAYFEAATAAKSLDQKLYNSIQRHDILDTLNSPILTASMPGPTGAWQESSLWSSRPLTAILNPGVLGNLVYPYFGDGSNSITLRFLADAFIASNRLDQTQGFDSGDLKFLVGVQIGNSYTPSKIICNCSGSIETETGTKRGQYLGHSCTQLLEWRASGAETRNYYLYVTPVVDRDACPIGYVSDTLALRFTLEMDYNA